MSLDYTLKFGDETSGPMREAKAAIDGTSAAIKGLQAASAKSTRIESAIKVTSDLKAAQTELSRLLSLRKSIAQSGTTDIDTGRLDRRIDAARGRVGALAEKSSKSGVSSDLMRRYNDEQKAAVKSQSEQEKAAKKAGLEREKASKKGFVTRGFGALKSAANNFFSYVSKGAALALGAIGIQSALGIGKSLFSFALGFRGMARFQNIMYRTQVGLRQLFRGTDSRPLLDSFERLTGLISPASSTGQAFGRIIQLAFDTIARGIQTATPYIEKGFAGALIGLEEAQIAITELRTGFVLIHALGVYVANAISKAWDRVTGGFERARKALDKAGGAVRALLPETTPEAASVAANVSTGEVPAEQPQFVEVARHALATQQALADLRAEAQSPIAVSVAANTNALGDVGPRVSKLSSDATPKAEKVGADITSGVARGMRSGIPDVAAAGAEVSAAAIGGAQNEADIRSPSGEARREIGQRLGQGTALGLRDTASLVQAAADSLVPSVGGSISAGSRSGAGGQATSSAPAVVNFFLEIPGMSEDDYRRIAREEQGNIAMNVWARSRRAA